MELSLRQMALITAEALSSAYERLGNRLGELTAASSDYSYASPEAFLAFADDKNVLKAIAELVAEKTKSGPPKTVFIIGIGGANLASKAVYDACAGYGENVFGSGRKMIFLDTVDIAVSEPALQNIGTLDSSGQCVVVIVSKSGKTLETLANAEFLLSQLEKKFGSVTERIVVVTAKSSPLWSDAVSKGISTIAIPDTLSDRFSAFSPTTLVPLALFGFLIGDFVAGAYDMRQISLTPEKNSALESAASIEEWHAKSFDIYDLFFFTPRLETIGKWQRQLIAESLGKERDLSGAVVHAGITPIVSIGTTDLHSNLQLTLAGPPTRITAFISTLDSGKNAIGNAVSLDVLDTAVTENSFSDLSATILTSVEQSYKEKGLPYFDIMLSEVSPRSLGQYMMFAMLQTVFLGALWNVNVFDQPDVEEYKERARTELGA